MEGAVTPTPAWAVILLFVWCLVVVAGLGLLLLYLWDSAQDREVERKATESRTVVQLLRNKDRNV